MKSLTLLTLCTLLSAPAFARGATKFYTFDMTGKKFHDNGFNTMGDSLPGNPDGIQLKLAGEIDVDFDITVSATNPDDAKSCALGRTKVAHNFTLVEVLGSPETDTGDTCDFTIVYQNGKKAVFKIESTGT